MSYLITYLIASYVIMIPIIRWANKHEGLDELECGFMFIFSPLTLPILAAAGFVVGIGKLLTWGD